MLFQKAEKLLSAARLSPYKQATGGNEPAALQLYFDNLRLSRSFYVPLSLFEVALRNSTHAALALDFKTDDWLLTEQTGFMIAPSLTAYDPRTNGMVTNQKALAMVREATREFKQKFNVVPPTGSALIPELSFGFWTSLFSKAYFLALNRIPLRAFMHRPRGTSWEEINRKLTETRHFRNRVYHYEPLCFERPANRINFGHVQKIHDAIVELMGWIDPELPLWLPEIDQVPETLKKLRAKYPKVP